MRTCLATRSRPGSTSLPPRSTCRAWRRPESPRPLRHIAYVGAVHAHKGAFVFEEVVKLLASTPGLRFTVFGGGDPRILARLRGLPRVRVRGYYRAGSLPRLLRREGVDLALLLSIWPESYGITLDECQAAGVPVVAFDHGAIGERLRRDGGSGLVPIEQGAAGVARTLATGPLPSIGHPAEGRSADASARAIAAVYGSDPSPGVTAPGTGRHLLVRNLARVLGTVRTGDDWQLAAPCANPRC